MLTRLKDFKSVLLTLPQKHSRHICNNLERHKNGSVTQHKNGKLKADYSIVFLSAQN